MTKERTQQRNFFTITEFLDDFELDKQFIVELLEKANDRITTSKAILTDLNAGTKDKNYLLNQYLLAIQSETYVPRNVTFKDLISSGNLKLLNDVIIKNSLIQYYSELENKQSQLNLVAYRNLDM